MKKSALGKGIGSLIQSNATNAILGNIDKSNKEQTKNSNSDETSVLMVNVESIHPNEFQPRKIFKEKDLKELSESIKESGLIQPLIVLKKDKGYELIAGERRLRASKMAGLTEVPVVLKRITDKEKLTLAIIENVQRSDLNCVEEALAYYQLMEDFSLTQEEVAKKVGKDRSSIANYLRILKLPRQVIDMLQKELLSFGHAKLLAVLKESNRCILLAKETVEKELSVRELEKMIRKNSQVEFQRKNDNFYEEKMQKLKDSLEKKTGFHFGIKVNDKCKGQIHINFNNEAEFNDIYDHLLR